MKRSLMGWMLLCILSTATLVSGQTAFTSLRGLVKDPSGALVPGAKVTITDPVTGHTSVATANAAGEYIFTQIPPAKYTITVTAMGFGDQSKTAELLVNQPATVDFALTVQSTAVTVDVSAGAQTLNTTDATLGNSMDNTLIQAIPSETRNVPSEPETAVLRAPFSLLVTVMVAPGTAAFVVSVTVPPMVPNRS